MYISPSTSENQQLRQCLSYFFPVYSYSSSANQNRVQSVRNPQWRFSACLQLIFSRFSDLHVDLWPCSSHARRSRWRPRNDHSSPIRTTHGGLDEPPESSWSVSICDWVSGSCSKISPNSAVDKTQIQPTHANLAVDILFALYDSDRTVEEQKTLCQLLGQLQIESGLDMRSIQKINILLTYHEDVSHFHPCLCPAQTRY